MKRFALLTCSSLLALGLVACGDSEPPAEPVSKAVVERQTADPGKAVESIAAKIKDNNVLEAVQLALPPAKLDEVRAEWKKKMNEDPPSEEDKAKFAETMHKLTEPEAEAKLYAELEPTLVKFDTEMAAQMPMMIGMGQGFAMQSIEANAELSPEQKKQAGEVIAALAGWLQTVKISDRDLAKKAVGVVVKTARKLELKTLDEVRALDFDHAMSKAGIILGGLKEVLKLYDFDVDAALGSTKAKVLSQGEGQAKVAVTYTLLGKELSGEQEMIELDGRWYGKDTVEQLVENLSNNVPGSGASSDPE